MAANNSFILDCLQVGYIQTNCYLFGDLRTSEIAIIDPGGDEEGIADFIKDRGYRPIVILLTHEHPDHTQAVLPLAQQYKIPIKAAGAGHLSKKMGADRGLKNGSVIEIGDERLEVLESPGHSEGGLIFICPARKLMFVGDSIFQGSIGRTDFGGDMNQLMLSIKKNIMGNAKINDGYILYPGHGPETTVGDERRYNPFRRDFT